MSQQYLLPTYNPVPIAFTHGQGVWLYDAAGNRYLDAYCGIAVTGLGHNHPTVTKSIQLQAEKIIHASNLVEIPQQQELAKALSQASGINARSFFCNSGAEAVETAVKLSHLYGHDKNIDEPVIVVMSNAFHGRTMAALSACGSQKIKKGFGPLMPGFVRANYNDPLALESIAKTNKNVVAVLVEPVQGEAAVQVPTSDYLTKVRKICDANDWLMIVDEVQTGMGRTGKLFAYQHENIKPDAMTLAKGLANGVPIGALLVNEKHANLFTPGSHGSTFGGNPLSCSAALATLQEIQNRKLWENAATQGKKLLTGLQQSLAKHPNVKNIRGKGLMLGIELDRPCREIIKIALKHGIIFNIARDTTIRLLPPLIIEDAEVEFIIEVIPKLIEEFVDG